MKSFFKNKHGAMEMSVGTIVTIVLLMAVLVLGLVLVQKIFGSASNAVDNVDSQIQNQITKLFEDDGAKLVVYPSSREVTLKRKDDTPKGFAFAVRNNDGTKEKELSYSVIAEDVTKCGAGFSEEDAEDLLLGSTGSYTLGPGEDTISNRDLVKFVLNENVPLCTIVYRLVIKDETGNKNYDSATVYVTIK